jgi:hypothetical protein
VLTWLKHLLGGQVRPSGGAPVGGPSGPGVRPGVDPVHAVLDHAGLPWRVPRAALAQRYGIRRHQAYGWDVIEVETERPIVHGLIWPLSVQVSQQFSPRLPATVFSGITHFGTDARDNLRRTADQLSPRLGAARIGDHYNTVQCEWRSGAAAVRLTVWPRDMQPPGMNQQARQRDPRLATGCHVVIETGFRPAATAAEMAWLDSFVPIGRIRYNSRTRGEKFDALCVPESQLEFVREPVADLERFLGLVGCSADGAALIFCRTRLYVVPTARVIGFRVERTLPAKGGGGSGLEVECRTDYEEISTKWLTIAGADGAEDLNELAAAISAVTGKPFELGDYTYDF